jgi:glycosyltransferase involved in cell wall biosynthesis
MPSPRPLRIGIEAQRLFRPHKHGMDIVALELIRHLQKLDDFNEYYVFVKPDEDNQVLRETANCQIIPVPGGPYPLWEQRRLPQAIRPFGLDMLHCTSNTAPLHPGVPLVVTLHDIIYLESLSLTKGTLYQRIGNLYRRWNVPRVVPACEQLITVSAFEQHRIQQHFGAGVAPVAVVGNSASTHFRVLADPAALAATAAKYQLPAQFMLLLANTDPKKNLPGVLRALALLKAQDQLRLPLVLVDFTEEHLLAVLAALGLPELRTHIVRCGYVPNHELPHFYNLSTLFLYPSLRESFGIPLLEAMACGTPVITSSTSAMPEVAGGAALLIDPFDPRTIAAAIARLDTEPGLRQELVARGLARAQEYSWGRTAAQVKDIYEAVYQRTQARLGHSEPVSFSYPLPALLVGEPA